MSETPLPGLVEVYNLGPGIRSALQQAGHAYSVAGQGLQPGSAAIIISAGWNNEPLKQIYKGGVQSAWSRREGPDIITSVTCLSGLATRSYTMVDASLTFAPGSSVNSAVVSAARKFRGVTVDPKNVSINGTIGPRGYTFTGLVSDCLSELSRVYGFHWGITDGVFMAAMDGQPLGRNAVDINSSNGFLMRAEAVTFGDYQIKAGVLIRSLLNPWVEPNKVVNLTSEVNPELNGSYVSWSVTHMGDTHSTQWETISETTLVNFSQGS